MPVLMRPSLHDAQLVGDRGFPLVVRTEATVKRESHEGSTGSRSATVQIRCDFPLFSTILKWLGLLSTYLRKHRISVSNAGRARFELLRPLYVCLLGMIYLSTIRFEYPKLGYSKLECIIQKKTWEEAVGNGAESAFREIQAPARALARGSTSSGAHPGRGCTPAAASSIVRFKV